jgi:hypothetical protein
VAIYARVSNRENTKHLETQAERLLVWCTLQRWSVHQVVKECGSGINDQRPRFLAPLADPTMSHMVVEHKDRASHFGIASIQTLLALCQQYIIHFCTQADPNSYAVPVYATELAERGPRVAIQQAAGIAKSWRTNRQNAYNAYLEALADYAQAQAKATTSGVPLDRHATEPQWHEWSLPELRVPALQANANVVVVEKSGDSTFDYWLRISTLDKGHPLRIPVKLASYHREALAGRTINTSTALHKRKGIWWLTLSFDENVSLTTEPQAPRVGADVGIANFITTSTGKTYGSFHGKLARRHKRDREKRRRKAKLRACLKKKGVEKLPSTSSANGQRLGRHVRQEINRAINQMLADCPDARIIYEDLSVASMRFKARSMNAYLYASNLAHIPEQIAWATSKRGMAAHPVKASYSSQECHRCHYPDRANRPDQQTFKCIVCGHRNHADRNAALNLAQRFGDQELATCNNRGEVKALLLRRHGEWKQKYGLAVVQPAVQLGLWDSPRASTDVCDPFRRNRCK